MYFVKIVHIVLCVTKMNVTEKDRDAPIVRMLGSLRHSMDCVMIDSLLNLECF